MIAALNPATWALLTLSSKLHPPLIISVNGELEFTGSSALFSNVEHASRGLARNNTPGSPELSIEGAKLASMESNERVTLVPINTTLAAEPQQPTKRSENNKARPGFIALKAMDRRTLISEREKGDDGD